MFKPYIKYLQDNPQKYWFKAKLFGWGWVPARGPGWAVLGLYVAGMFFFASTIDKHSSAREVWLMFLLPAAVLTTLLIVICYKTGERPRWQWGVPEKYKNEEPTDEQ